MSEDKTNKPEVQSQRTVQIGKYTVTLSFLGKRSVEDCLDDIFKSHILLDSN